jgi:enoyl-CoA hydratase/carnithine racemase
MFGKHRAFELFLTSSRLTAEEALALGLVNRVVPDAQCVEEALGIARELAALPPVTVALTKRLITRAAALDDDYELDRAYATYLRTAEASGDILEQAKRDHQERRRSS